MDELIIISLPMSKWQTIAQIVSAYYAEVDPAIAGIKLEEIEVVMNDLNVGLLGKDKAGVFNKGIKELRKEIQK